MLNGKIDLRSDTITQPAAAMREVMAGAVVGDGARLCDAVVMEGGSVGAGATVDHSVVGPGAQVGPGASLSALTIIGEGQDVSDGRCLSGARIPEDA